MRIAAVRREKAGRRKRGEAVVVAVLSRQDLEKLDLRVATILEAERVKDTDRLLRLKVRLGGEERQIVAGIGGDYGPEDLPGRRIVMVANLKPAVIRGVESRGMLLAAAEGKKSVLVGPCSEVPDGTRVTL
ncbi:MAG: methionine--tRNA ligase subunit beta [Candidatus Eisenbacteria sp.]|nr:methionine--tRNA ligase subunit beta [Candidatus Eisenbacteria bacterium]